MKIILTLLIVFAGLQTQAQSINEGVISNSGGTTSNSSFIISFTIGETFTGSITNDTSINQGFWEGIGSENALSTEEFTPEDDFVTIYPNPITNFFTIKLRDVSNYDISLLNIQGQKVMSKKINAAPQGNLINISSFSKGVYILKLSIAETNTSKSFKIIKN